MEEQRLVPAVKYLSVPSVQEIASKLDANSVIPERYIRPEIEADVVVVGDIDTVELPVIDMERLLDPQLCEDEIVKLDYACEHWGFFQLINHGIPGKVIEQMKIDIQEFFKLPLEQKNAIAKLSSELEGYGQHFVISEDQKLDWADALFLTTLPHHRRDLKFWPVQPPTFRDALSEYSLEIKRVAFNLIEAMAKGLRIELEIFIKHFRDLPQIMRFNHYPPCPIPNQVLGLSPHSDNGCLTLLLEVNDVQGLQIKKNGNWIVVQPIPKAFCVNVGNAMEILTNGKYKSIEHRATINTQKERFSIATFQIASPDAKYIGPIPELVGDGKVNYKTMLLKDFSNAFYAAKLDGKNFLENMKIHN